MNSPPSAREKILLTAHDLFYRDGIRATGIDKVIAESGVAKVTFYRHFPSKNALIVAFLEYRHQRWINWFNTTLIKNGAQPGAGLGPLIPTLDEWFSNPDFRGCAFINSVAELGGSSEDVMMISHKHKQDMCTIIANMLPESDQRDELADAVAIAVDGAIFRAQLTATTTHKHTALHGLALLLNALSKQFLTNV